MPGGSSATRPCAVRCPPAAQAAQWRLSVSNANAVAHLRQQTGLAQPRRPDRCWSAAAPPLPGFVPRAFALKADGTPAGFPGAAEAGAPLDDGFGSQREVGATREPAARQQSLVDRLRSAATQAAERLKRFTLHVATLVARSLVLGVAAQIAQRKQLQRMAAKQQERAKAKLAAAAEARRAAAARIQQAFAQRSRADRAFVNMLLSQDNPARSLEEKWEDLSRAMRSKQAPEFRRCTARLFSAALDSSHAVQAALKTEATKGSKALDRLVSQHDCVQEEEELRSVLFAQILNGVQC